MYQGQIKAYNSLQEANKQLRLAKEAAEKSDKLKSEFLAQMSHEIRTPINIIFGFTSLIRDIVEDKLQEDHTETFEMINNAGQRIMRTIDEILEMSQIQTGSYEFRQEEIDLEGDVLKNISYDFSLLARTKKIAFTYHNKSNGKKIFADKFMVNQIFTNLIDNAIKFTSEGSIDVIQYNDDNGRMCVDVKDTGIGISEDYMPRLYSPFSQEDSGYTRKYEGNGLGLAIVKKYIEFNKAEITVKSKKGAGTTFTVKFKDF